MSPDLVAGLLPVLGRSLHAEFNVFDVMHHGTHEKQLSNVFAWLLEASGSHGLSDRFTHVFLDEVNRALELDGRDSFPADTPYRVSQEVNTTPRMSSADIADIVVESADAVLVVENYYTSDGHGHSYDGYLRYGQRTGKRAAVVLLCRDEDRSLLAAGWEGAAVVTYGALIDALLAALEGDASYPRRHPEAHSFLVQLHRKFVKGRGPMQEPDALAFVVAMCDAGEARRYGRQPVAVIAKEFANDVAQQAEDRFHESRALLQTLKDRLGAFARMVLVAQLKQALGDEMVGKVKANWSGIWAWSVFFDVGTHDGPSQVALMFGPSAWHQATTVDPTSTIDASYLHLWDKRTQRLCRSSVSLQEILEGLLPEDVRLRDEVLSLASVDSDPA